MTNHEPDQDIRELLEERAQVRPEELEPIRGFVSKLPARPRGRQGRGGLAAAAGIVVLLGLGALVVMQIPFGTSGAAPGAPNPAAFAGDPRLKVCNATADRAEAIIELAHVRDYPLQLPAAYELTGLRADPEAPALVIVFKGPATPQDANETPAPGTHDLCMVVGADAASWKSIAVVGVDTTGLLAYVPEPTGTPIPADLAPWADRCGGQQAGILAVLRVVEGWDFAGTIDRLDPVPAELVPMPAAEVVVYDAGHPFPPLATAPPGASSPEPRNPLAPGHHDICVLVGRDPATAQRFIHEDVVVTFPSAVATPGPATESPSASSAPIPSASAGLLPAQVDPAQCAAMSFAPDRCLAVVEAAREQASLAWMDIGAVQLTRAPGDALLGSRPLATVTFRLRDGSTVDQVIRCGISGMHSLVCSDHPTILLTMPNSGYPSDPCAGPPQPCPSAVPRIDPSAAAHAVPLEIPARDIPVTATGHLELDMGTATLPNGVLSAADFSLADPYTRAFAVASPNGVSLVVRSHDPTRPPFGDLYAHGWYPGTEQVEVFLVLDVTSFQPGALLQVRNLVVR